MPNDKKYELVDKGPETELSRIRALKDIPEIGIKSGDTGGFVGSEKNLSHQGLCWVWDNAVVSGEALVLENAQVYDRAYVGGWSKVCGDATIRDLATVEDRAVVCGSAELHGSSTVKGYGVVTGFAKLYDCVRVQDAATVTGNVKMYNTSRAMRRSFIGENVELHDNCIVDGTACLTGNNRYSGNIRIV